MQIYQYGKIVSKNKNYLIIDNHGSGYLVYVPRIDRFSRDENRKIYLYEYENDYTKITYGFASFRERILFEDLISIQGIGPKTAISALNSGMQNVINLIASNDWKSLSKIPYLSEKNAKQIVFEFHRKYRKFAENDKNQPDELNTEPAKKLLEKNDDLEDIALQKTFLEDKTASNLEDSLKMLGFKSRQIDYALAKVQPSENFENLIEEAIKLISNAREFRS
ncbi:Holliday junction branch migration protein RuvA [Mycoplasma flocculare]|uniref:Holliday junction branch migration complex subunit RuvA n=3 Tax=Mesomycoplasma TaxID=2923352 RepID=A0A0A8E7B9_MESFC|nr:Holliday junction branch migration protein RuvA [Mesomycoplasma flocculare]MXR39611.1 Holliday junction branch migration protein RuvA [Mycoplasma sp. MF12]AJC49918.1 Holliday junction ATP-dependent DNA helicase RuvA [Mesomycoplasma flocculare ATCC 27399]MXR06015.1 Holliday junction branch migration protein RuvA [Mesomycoplasma flocculare]MXR12461.1 Holliday junction branch migration protein RuvA [Mesomycoplasma flocculare]MXR13679.1 Holliday junction branch migration protein RuvA [Mesomycop